MLSLLSSSQVITIRSDNGPHMAKGISEVMRVLMYHVTRAVTIRSDI
jgi:hypothetical protein